MDSSSFPWREIVAAVGLSGLLIVGAIWLCVLVLRRFLDEWLKRGIEKHKAQLEKAAVEHEVRFVQLHDERARLIISVYGKVARLTRTWQVIPDTGDRNLLSEFGEAFRAFYMEFDGARILFSDETCELIEEFATELGFDYQRVCAGFQDTKGDFLAKLRMKRDRMESEKPQILRDIKGSIEADFRRLLGVEATED
jgi:hypothetical protein